MHIWLAIDELSDRANTGNVTLAELLQYYNYGLANAFSAEISKKTLIFQPKMHIIYL